MSKGSNLRFLGDFNQIAVLDAIRRSPTGLSRVELGTLTGLTPQTMSNIARRLIDTGLVREAERVQQARGKPRTLLRVVADGHFALGVHLDPATLTFVLLDLAGDVRHCTRRPVPAEHDPQAMVAVITATAREMLDASGVDQSRVLGLGVAAPGPIDATAGVMINPPQLRTWRNVSLRSELHAATGMHVLLDKDVTAAATAELWASAGNSQNFVFCYLGSGVGVGLVLNGEVVRGASNNIGEVGELLVDLDADEVGFGHRGSLATACMPQALVVRAVRSGVLPADSVPARVAPGQPDNEYVAVDHAFTTLCALAEAGDHRAAALIDRSAHGLAVGLAAIVNLVDADRVVIGGPAWSRVAERYLAVLPHAVAAKLVVCTDGIPVVGSLIGEHVAAQGAAALVLDHFLSPRPSALLME